MVDDHEDYETGSAPAAHGPSHGAGQSDEVSVAGLAGEPLALAAHKILPAIHHIKFTAAEARAAINNIFGADGKADSDIDLDLHRLTNVLAPFGVLDGDNLGARNNAISAHAALPTVHQNAPALIETHRLAGNAHHNEYTDAKARSLSSPLSLPPPAFRPYNDNHDYVCDTHLLLHRVSVLPQYFLSPVIIDSGCTIIKVTLFGYINLATDILSLHMVRASRIGTKTTMVDVVGNWTGGYGNRFNETIANPVIDNASYTYSVYVLINPNSSVLDCGFTGAQIEFTG